MADQHMSRAQQRARNLAIAAVAGQAGCASLGIIIAALFAGLVYIWKKKGLEWGPKGK